MEVASSVITTLSTNTTQGLIFPLLSIIRTTTRFLLVRTFLTAFPCETDDDSCTPIATRCNKDGEFLTADATPEPPAVPSQTDWFPFNSRVGFELADFVFTDAELSKKKINRLLELWAATLVPHDVLPPATDHVDLLRQIDSIPLGSVPWESFCLNYDEPLPRNTHLPEWKTTKYEIWFRNPREVIRGILANPEFDGHIDYSAYREFEDTKRRYCHMMSGDWAWQKSVRYVTHWSGCCYLPWDRM